MIKNKKYWLIALFLLCFFAYDGYRQLNAPLLIKQTERISIKSGGQLQDAINQLRKADAFSSVRQWIYLRIYARFSGEDANLRVGDFDIAVKSNTLRILNILHGRSVQSELRIPEGWRFKQILKLIREHADIKHTLPLHISDQEIMTKLGRPNADAEGVFFPDTYHFSKGMTDVEVLRHAMILLTDTLNDEWANRESGLIYKNKYEALIMASLVEKETGAAEERAQIAGVFLRRLKIGMRLQTDPTVIYGMGDRYDGNIRKSDLQTDTPYNTYTRSGLPPTPICMPSRAAIHAALHPDDDGSIYFVAKGDGSRTHEFSKTLAQHNAAVARYLARQR